MLFGWFCFQSKKILSKSNKSNWLLVGVGAVLFYFWFKGFYGFWWFLEVERQNISPNTYYQKTGGLPERMAFNIDIKNHKYQCELQNNKLNNKEMLHLAVPAKTL